jgi:hypothetical protein
MAVILQKATSAHLKAGMKVLGPFPSIDDENVFVWLRGFPDESSRESMKARFYEGPLWIDELEGMVMPMIADYRVIVVTDSAGLWDQWPGTPGLDSKP